MSDAHSAAYLKYTEFEAVTGISALDLIAFHQTAKNSIRKITAADLGVAPLIATDLATSTVTSGTESWHNVTDTGVTITFNTDPDDGDLVRVSLEGVNSVALVGTVNGEVDPTFIGDGNSVDFVFALTSLEWKKT